MTKAENLKKLQKIFSIFLNVCPNLAENSKITMKTHIKMESLMRKQKGASAEEILKVCSVAMSLGGTLAVSQIAMFVKFLKEKGLI